MLNHLNPEVDYLAIMGDCALPTREMRVLGEAHHGSGQKCE